MISMESRVFSVIYPLPPLLSPFQKTILTRPYPTLCRYMEKKLVVQLNGSRQVNGTLRGYDPFMNIVLDSSVEVKRNGEQVPIGMVVSKNDEKRRRRGRERRGYFVFLESKCPTNPS